MEQAIELAVEGSREATGRLFDTLEQIDQAVAIRPSLLPGWSIAHVLTHLARNADSFVRILEAATQGREVRQYAGGDIGRNQDIEEGAKRTAAEIIDDLRSACVRLDATWSEMPEEVWQQKGPQKQRPPPPLPAVTHKPLAARSRCTMSTSGSATRRLTGPLNSSTQTCPML